MASPLIISVSDSAVTSESVSANVTCFKFKLYANSRIEFIGFGEDQLKSFQIMKLSEEMKLPVAGHRVGKWKLPTPPGQ